MSALPAASSPSTVGVLPDLTGLDRVFTYAVPPELAPRIELGSVVRVHLNGRRVRAWVVEIDPPSDLELHELEEVSLGPDAAIVELARFGAWRYGGRLRPFLLAGTPSRSVPSIAPRAPASTIEPVPPNGPIHRATVEALGLGNALLRLPPGEPRLGVVEAAIAVLGASILVLVPEHRDAEVLTSRLQRAGHAVASLPTDFAEAAAGGRIVVGTRAAVLGRVGGLAGIVVLDAEAEAYRSERAPTWRATVLATERARRAKVPCLFVSPAPGVSELEERTLVTFDRAFERAGWPLLEVIDRRGEDPRTGLYSERLAPLIRGALEGDRSRPVLAVLNRTGRARLLACGSCGALARCEQCGSALRQLERPAPGAAGILSCPGCGATRPLVCGDCASTRLKVLRVGVAKAAEELGALVGAEVTEVTGRSTDELVAGGARLLVGTEAVLHRVRAASLVAFLDFDQELLAPRAEAGEQALALLARAGRLVRGRSGRVAVQTRVPDHEVLEAALHGDPGILMAAEDPRRRRLNLPPYAALALVGGEEAGQLMADLALASPQLEQVNLDDDRWLIRALDHAALADGLAAIGPPRPGVRVEVDPLRL